MPEEHGVGGKQPARSNAEIHEGQIAALIPLYKAVRILEAVQHASAHHTHETVSPYLGIPHDVSSAEIVDRRDHAGRKLPPEYPGIATQGEVDRVSSIAHGHSGCVVGARDDLESCRAARKIEQRHVEAGIEGVGKEAGPLVEQLL